MRVSLRQLIKVVVGIALVGTVSHEARASGRSGVVEGGTLAIPMTGAAARVVKPRNECPATRSRPATDRRVGRVLLRTPPQQQQRA